MYCTDIHDIQSFTIIS